MTKTAVADERAAVAWCRTLTLAALLGLGAGAATAGGYMQSGGWSYVSTGVHVEVDSGKFDKRGDRQSRDCDNAFALPVYAEYGWSYYRTVFASAAVTHKRCPGEQAWGLADSRIGVRGRVDPFSNDLVWEASVTLPTSRLTDARRSDTDSLGATLMLHWNPRPDPYDLDLDRDPHGSGWGAGIGVTTWQRHLPHEVQAYVSYTRALTAQQNFGLSAPPRLSVELEHKRAIGRAHAARTEAVDSHDDFHVLSLGASLSFRVRREESLRFSAATDLSGKNHDYASTIGVSYGWTF